MAATVLELSVSAPLCRRWRGWFCPDLHPSEPICCVRKSPRLYLTVMSTEPRSGDDSRSGGAAS